MIVPEYIPLDLSGFNVIILTSPHNKQVRNAVVDHLNGAKFFIDLDLQYDLPPLTVNYNGIIIPNAGLKELIEGYIVEAITPDEEVYKLEEKDSNSLFVDFHYTKPDDLKELCKHFKLTGCSFGKQPNFMRFNRIKFKRAYMAQELYDFKFASDCRYALFTHIERNEDITIPNTLIDCSLMGMEIIVTENLREAAVFVLDNNIGHVIGRENTGILHDIVKNLPTVESLRKNSYSNALEELLTGD